jgi:plastocyanin
MRSQLFAATALSATLVFADDSSSSSSTDSSATATTGIPATSTFEVKVGNNGLNFDPDTLVASPGDLIHFHFYSSNHSVAQSSFDKPCEPIDGGIFSGFFTASGKDESSEVFSMRLNSTDPLWLYCSSGEHCKGGQSMVVNPA